MSDIRYSALTGVAWCALLALGACNRQGQDEMSWARSALERNNQLEIVASDPQSRSFTVRQKDGGELRMVRADELVAAPPGTVTGMARSPGAAGAAAPQPASASAAAPERAAGSEESSSGASAGEPAVAQESSRESAPPSSLTPQSGPAAREAASGRVLEQGPGYSIKAASTSTPAAGNRSRETNITSAAVERRHEPIICQGSRLLHIDNRNLEFEGDAVSAEDGCEIHITNTRISATGVGVRARAANVHIDNSLIEGDTAAIDASNGAQVYAGQSRFKGLSRRLDTATFHDLGGNIWN
jgi:hypothetical protein